MTHPHYPETYYLIATKITSVARYGLNEGEAMMLDGNTVLCYMDEQYYLVKAATEAEAIIQLINREETK